MTYDGKKVREELRQRHEAARVKQALDKPPVELAVGRGMDRTGKGLVWRPMEREFFGLADDYKKTGHAACLGKKYHVPGN